MEQKLKKKIGKAIPNDLIYNIIDDLNDIRKMKNEAKKKEFLNEIIKELNEASSIADEAYNTTKSDVKKKKIILFKEYNKARLDLVKEYINTGMYDLKLKFKIIKEEKQQKQEKKEIKKGECPESKILNPKSGRCVNKDGAIGKKLLKEPKEPKEPKQPKEPKEPKEPKKKKEPKQPKKENEIKDKDDYGEYLSKEEKELLKKLPSYILPNYIYNIDNILEFMRSDDSYSIESKINELKNMLNDLNDIDYEVSTDSTTRTAKQQDKIQPFLKYNKNRIDNVSMVLNNLIKKKGEIMNSKKK